MRSRRDLFQIGIGVRGAEGDHALVRGAVGGAVQSFSRLEADGNGKAAAEADDFLEPQSAGAASDQDAVQGAAGAQGFAHGVGAGEDGWLFFRSF